MQVCSRVAGTQLLLNEECVTLLLDLVVHIWYHLLELFKCLIELLFRDSVCLVLQLPHHGFVDQCEQVLDQGPVLGLCLLSQHQHRFLMSDCKCRLHRPMAVSLTVVVLFSIAILRVLHFDVLVARLVCNLKLSWHHFMALMLSIIIVNFLASRFLLLALI